MVIENWFIGLTIYRLENELFSSDPNNTESTIRKRDFFVGNNSNSDCWSNIRVLTFSYFGSFSDPA